MVYWYPMNLPKVYEPKEYESDIYALWEKSDAFSPKNRGNDDAFSIVIPPPNANGDLHIGHGLTLGIEDVMIRYNRMLGKPTLFLPGADHAGFETQVVYEKQLVKAGKSRFDFTREELYSQIYDFVAQNKENYESQFRRLGASLDWQHYTYTLDQKIVDQAYATFKKMWNEGLIYRGERLVNFCTYHGTGFADIEVEHKEEQSSLWYISYPLTDGSGSITVATTRPETMLGDTAVAVNPEDDRYKAFIGKTVRLPLTKREIPVIADEFVDKAFGTGAVKITPAHDPNDYEAGKRHDLPFITVISHEGKITHDMPEAYRGLEVNEARKRVVGDLKEQGFLEKEESYAHNVGHCYKCGTVIQPLLRDQWFVDMQPLTKPAIKALKDGEVTFYPDSKKQQLITYLEGLRDWNISRQIAWGIPIPAFQSLEDPEDWIFDDHVQEETISVNGKTYRRDPDVFDTWFSSSSWPYATLGLNSDDYKQFYPLSVMETGADILYPWVSRMLMFGLYNTGQIPFKDVYLHGLVLDQHGAKMSKSKGNVVNPMEKVDQYGSDAFRMGVIAGQSAGNNQSYDENRLVAARNFCNKLWNVARFVEDKIGDDFELRHNPKAETPADEWMLHKLQQSIREVSECLDNYRFSEASEKVYHLLWDDFADWYIEASKTTSNVGVLAYSLETILKLAHPFAPFVTETIWQTLKWEEDDLLIISPWPKAHHSDRKAADVFEQVKVVVTEIRYIKASMKLGHTNVLYHRGEKFLEEQKQLICSLARIKDVVEVEDGEGLHLTSPSFDCWLDIDQETAQAFVVELGQKIIEQEKLIAGLNGRLSNDSYVKNAPKAIVEETRGQLKTAQEQLQKLSEEKARFS
jgi:valyl-tRNA synthetase